MTKGIPTPPRNASNPLGESTFQKKTVQRLNGGLRRVEKWVVERFEEIPRERVTISANASGYAFNETRYDFQIDLEELRRITREIARRFNIEVPPEYLAERVQRAYETGTGNAAANLAALTDEYTREITQVLASQPWQKRVALMRGRVLEGLDKIHGDATVDLNRILSNAVEDGLNPRVVTESIRKRFRIQRHEAERLARTEITGALRRGNWDEIDDARERLGIRTGVLWASALSPTSRDTHVARHGNVYSTQEVREFYNRDANAINCKCGNSPILLDENEQPIGGTTITRMKAAKERYEKRQGE